MTDKRDTLSAAALPLADELALWLAAGSGDASARERLIEAYLPFARMLAAKLFAGRIDHDLEFAEYLQFATIGLIEAVDRFEPSRAIQFKTFSSHRINGAVLSGIERLSEKRAQISARGSITADRRDSAKATLDPGNQDVFQQLAEVAIGLALGYVLDDPAIYRNGERATTENQYAGLELQQLRNSVSALVNSLPQREKMVIKYHYLNHIPFNTIADIMGVTKGRVSQIHRHALELLRETIKSVKACDVAW